MSTKFSCKKRYGHKKYARIKAKLYFSLMTTEKSHDISYPSLAQPIPQLTAPINCHLPSTLHTRGPPLSPWQESIFPM